MVGQCPAILFVCILRKEHKKIPCAKHRGFCYLWYILNGLFLSRCAYWANICASSAVNASICIDNVRCSFCNSLCWATIHACTTADAIFANLISHNNPPMINIHLLSLSALYHGIMGLIKLTFCKVFKDCYEYESLFFYWKKWHG